ncbi:solute carrier family 52, riboflavin transporter, member 3-A-like [Stegodyphus dumicola]|uniref:solute carrier family 52, riboflavin transporter, member 3-A-like n=1 Tax=Stegodyphus dumicola TaxID=202533 RepID=UPI0015B084C3|nr:solute carrier family 52, riboflavin transporter, member 3-A-like [Stegodyphus dumicola]XP_035231439.1 solute carrier family 52, riboflavin transporter, member 3-A-like [Stegodyphus dumicola]XP_035231440.1 solute carrier family 52, riboflavin transporter, member 3-A-like [Stegodyphus dumicola]
MYDLKRRDFRVDLLSALFGLGSWIAMTGLWVELPVLVQRLPEGWALPSQLALFLQVANIGPVAYGFFHHWWPKWVTERSATHFQLGVGALSTLLLIFMWSWTVNGISLAFFLLSFGLSLVDCTSSVVFLPFMANFKACYLTPYLVGEGLSGLVPSLVAIAQGIENPECVNETRTNIVNGTNMTHFVQTYQVKEPRFSPEWFFAILLAMVLLSWLAFILLDKLPFCQTEKVTCFKGEECSAHEMEAFNKPTDISKHVSIRSPRYSRSLYIYLLFLQGWASVATFGIFPAIQPYSCLPYGDGPFHTAVTLCGVAYPAACLLAMFWEIRSIPSLSWISMVATLVSLYAVVTAVMSPHPPLLDSEVGPPLVVLCWVFFMFTFSYIKTMVTVLLGDYWGHRALFWCGAVTQFGAVIGALLMFLLVNVFHVFKDDGLCII